MSPGARQRAPWFAVAVVFALAACGEGPAPGPPTLGALDLVPVFELGAAEGEPWEAFGGVWDVAAGPDGHLAILDPEVPAVHVYDDVGAHVGSIQQAGLDPGALDRPSGLAWSETGELLLWDPGSSWISRFVLDDAGVGFLDRWRAFAFGETGFCASAGTAYLSYWQDGLVVHEVGPEGPGHSFGTAPDIPGTQTLGPELREIAMEELTPSDLLCTPEGVLDVSFFGAHIRLSDADGSVRWERDLDDFKPLSVFTPDGMGLGRRFDPEEGSPLLRSVVPWGEGMALLQHELRTEQLLDEGGDQVLESRLIRLADGVELSRTRALPLILATRGRRVYAVRADPYPQVVAFELSKPS